MGASIVETATAISSGRPARRRTCMDVASGKTACPHYRRLPANAPRTSWSVLQYRYTVAAQPAPPFVTATAKLRTAFELQMSYWQPDRQIQSQHRTTSLKVHNEVLHCRQRAILGGFTSCRTISLKTEPGQLVGSFFHGNGRLVPDPGRNRQRPSNALYPAGRREIQGPERGRDVIGRKTGSMSATLPDFHLRPTLPLWNWRNFDFSTLLRASGMTRVIFSSTNLRPH